MGLWCHMLTLSWVQGLSRSYTIYNWYDILHFGQSLTNLLWESPYISYRASLTVYLYTIQFIRPWSMWNVWYYNFNILKLYHILNLAMLLIFQMLGIIEFNPVKVLIWLEFYETEKEVPNFPRNKNKIILEAKFHKCKTHTFGVFTDPKLV